MIGYLNLSPCQFGCTRITSASLATLWLKETVGRYLSENSSVFVCFIDLSKAFHRDRHGILMNKIKEKGFPPSFYG